MPFYINDVLIGGANEIVKELGLDPKLIPQRRNKEFEIKAPRDTAGNMKRDRDNNPFRTAKISGKPECTIDVPYIPKNPAMGLEKGRYGHEVRLRYAVTQRSIPDGDMGTKIDYEPKILTLAPGEDGSIMMESRDEFLYWFLHPWNLHSPYHKVNTVYEYEFKDDEARSKAENSIEEARINALGMIVGQNAKGMSTLRNLAKGMNIASVDEMTDDVVRKKLRDIAGADPYGFMNKVDSREVIFSGTIQDAVDKGILNLNTLNGMKRWYLNGKEILPVAFGVDERTALMTELSNKWYQYADEIKDSLNGKTIASNLNNPEMDKFFEEKTELPEQKAQVDPKVLSILKEMEKDDVYANKIKELAMYDLEDPSLHWAKKKSYETNREAVEAYKLSQRQNLELETA